MGEANKNLLLSALCMDFISSEEEDSLKIFRHFKAARHTDQAIFFDELQVLIPIQYIFNNTIAQVRYPAE